MPYPIDSTTWRSPNYSLRSGAIKSVVVHSCEGALPEPKATSLPWLCKPPSATHTNPVSCHYYVCRDTVIYQLVADEKAAWHVGNAQPNYLNEVSIGIECEHRSGQDWPAAQKDALAWLLRELCTQYRIPNTFVDTHGYVAIAGPYQRKVDPSNWPHPEFIAWRDAVLAAPILTTVFAGAYGAIARQDYRAGAPPAAYFAPGLTITIDDFHKNEYRHAASGIGFLADGDLVF